MLKLYDLSVEYRHDPMGLDCLHPRFSWKLESDLPDTIQKSYILTVNGQQIAAENSNQSILVPYTGEALTPRTRYTWEVCVQDNHGDTAFAQGSFETGLLSGTEFFGKAGWITSGWSTDIEASPVFSKAFTPCKPVAHARLYATCLGLYEAELNGIAVSDTYFAPGWTSYHKRLQYQTYPLDVRPGENKLCVTLGNGWYKGYLGFNPTPNHYGDTLALLAMVVLTYSDGSEEIIGTDESWLVSESTIRFSEIYDGETQDTTMTEKPAVAAVLYDNGFQMLVGQENEPVRCLKRLGAVKHFTAPNGDNLYDFGQNLTGWVEVKVTGHPGQKLVLRHAESLDENGNFYTDNLSFAKATDTYVLNGQEQCLRPHFTFHGFRYICVEGLEEGQEVTFTACHLSSDLTKTGSFTCSDERINRLQQNIVWGMRDNYLDVPTDCPQRSERLGWTGDATAFTPTAAFNANIMPFMRKWLRDLAADQDPATGMAQVIPDVLSDGVGGSSQNGSAYWGDCATVLPWTLYQVYGDKQVLEEQYPSMKIWVEYIRRQCGDNGLWQTGFQYGDWLGLDSESCALGDERKGATDDYFTANVCYVWSLQILSESANVLGYAADALLYGELHDKVLHAFREEYVTKTGRLVSETQTALILALHFGMVEDQHRSAIADRLESNISAHKTHLTTGFIGTPYACLTLSDNGKHEVAGKLLLQEDNPGWLYEVGMGATTVWERWNSILPDGSFNPANMNSLNHYAYGSIGDWMYTRLAGLRLLEPGYKRFALKPMFMKGITWVKLEFESVYGTIRIGWRCENGTITVDVQVPANTQCLLTLPERENEIHLGSGSWHYSYPTETKLEKERYTLESSLKTMIQHPAARPLLDQYMPGMTDNPMLQYVMNEPIASLLAYAPDAKPLYEMILQAMNAAKE